MYVCVICEMRPMRQTEHCHLTWPKPNAIYDQENQSLGQSQSQSQNQNQQRPLHVKVAEKLCQPVLSLTLSLC